MVQGPKQGDSRFIGNGNISEASLRSENAFMALMGKLGHGEDVTNYIAYRCLPNGHKDKINSAQAIKQFFPKQSASQVYTKIIKALLDGSDGFNGLLCQLLHGQEIEQCKAVYDEKQEKKVKKSTRTRKPISWEDKAKIMATKLVNAEFRQQNDLSTQGKIPNDLKDKLQEYVEKHYESTYSRITKQFKQGSRVPAEA